MNSTHLTGFIDIHSHLLSGMDDGPSEFGQSLKAAERYQAIGVGTVIATPHWIQGTGWAPAPEMVVARAKETEEIIRAAGFPLRVLPGMEIALTDFLCGHFAAADLVSLGETGVFLIEFPLNSALNAPTSLGVRTLLARAGKKQFIIAHPERCAMFHDNLERVQEMVAEGIRTQVNIGSILGYYGIRSQRTALSLLRSGLVHYLGTDSHARTQRMPPTPSEMAKLTDLIGLDAVTAGFRDNPRRLLSGEAVPPLQYKGPEAAESVCPTEPRNFMQGLLQLFREH